MEEDHSHFWKKFYNVNERTFSNWKWQVQNIIKTPSQLEKVLPLSEKEKEEVAMVCREYRLNITPYYLSLINLNDPDDPIRKQAIPSIEELLDKGYNDPLAEEKQKVTECLVRRYEDRALFITTNYCYVYCRHCTRKRIWKNNSKIDNLENLEKVVEYISREKEIKEVIISGGDPLTLPYPTLEKILSSLSEIKHLDIIRIGTRVPVVLPMKLYDKQLLKILKKSSQKKPIWLATHFNHPNEITYFTKKAIDNLLKIGIPVINQSVLLKSINDDAEIMKKLCQKLIKIKVKPYYLFYCDNTKGVSHFITPIEKGIEIIGALQGKISGYAIPTYIIDLPNGKGKVPLMPNYYEKENGKIIINYNQEKILIEDIV
jgi:lysine 2,3-aminomutase